MNGALYLSLNSELLPTEYRHYRAGYFHGSDPQGRWRVGAGGQEQEKGRGRIEKRKFIFGALFCNRV